MSKKVLKFGRIQRALMNKFYKSFLKTKIWWVGEDFYKFHDLSSEGIGS